MLWRDIVMKKKNGGKVNLEFKHALCQICFKAQNNNKSGDYTITSISVGGLNDTGIFLPQGETWYGTSGKASYTISGNITLPKPEEGKDKGEVVTISDPTKGGDYKTRTMNLMPQFGTKMTLTVNMTSNNAQIVKTKEIDVHWYSGMRYIYTIEIEPGGEIGFTANVNEYGEGKVSTSHEEGNDPQPPVSGGDPVTPPNDGPSTPGMSPTSND